VSFSAGGFPRVGGGVDEEAIEIALRIERSMGCSSRSTDTGCIFFFIDVVEEIALIPYYANDTFVSVSASCYIVAQWAIIGTGLITKI
jgi:hypothetical protein